MKSSNSKNAVVVFFLIAFGVPWLVWTLKQVYDLTSESATFLKYAGDFCSVGGLVAAYVAHGSGGLRDLLIRGIRFKFSPIWWVLTILIPIAYVMFAFASWSSLNGGIADVDPSIFLRLFSLPALAAFLTGPLGEEFGWRGFFLPVFLNKYSLLTSSVIVGLVWGVWHYPLYFNGIFASLGTTSIFLAGTVLTSILMSIIFVHTRGSILAAILYHWLINVLPITFYRMFRFSDIDLQVEALQLVGKGLIIVLLYWIIGARTMEEKKTLAVRELV